MTQTVTCNYTGSLPIAPGTTLPAVTLPATVAATASGGITDTVTLTSADASPSSVSASVSGSILSVPQYGLTSRTTEVATSARRHRDLHGDAVAAGRRGHRVGRAHLFADAGHRRHPTAVSGTGWTCSKSGQTANCTYSGALPIAPGTTLPPITITASVSAGASGNVSSTGTVQSSDGASATAVDSANAGHPHRRR